MYVCVFSSFIVDIKFVRRTSRGHKGGRSHTIFHRPSFCGAYLIFSREKDSAIPFPRRPLSRILCTNDLIVLHSLGVLFFSEKKLVYRDPTHVPTCQKVTRLPLSYQGDRFVELLANLILVVHFTFIFTPKLQLASVHHRNSHWCEVTITYSFHPRGS